MTLSQRSFNFIDFGTIRKRIYIFLLVVVNSNLDPILIAPLCLLGSAESEKVRLANQPLNYFPIIPIYVIKIPQRYRQVDP